MSPLATFEVRVLPIDQLKPAPYNPRKALKPDSPAYRKLRASLTDFGLVEPLVWNELTGHVVGGHARLRILRELGVAEVPVSVVRLSELREKALNVVLNNQEAQGRYDTAKLAELLTELEDLPELDLTGFDAAALRNLRMEPETAQVEETEASGLVTVMLEMNEATYAQAGPRLDELVGEFDLTCHVRRT